MTEGLALQIVFFLLVSSFDARFKGWVCRSLISWIWKAGESLSCSCGLSQTDIIHPDQSACDGWWIGSYSGDGRQAATLQQLSITHTSRLRSYFMLPLYSRMDAAQVDLYAPKNLIFFLVVKYIFTNLTCAIKTFTFPTLLTCHPSCRTALHKQFFWFLLF